MNYHKIMLMFGKFVLKYYNSMKYNLIGFTYIFRNMPNDLYSFVIECIHLILNYIVVLNIYIFLYKMYT